MAKRNKLICICQLAPESLQIISFNCRGLREKKKKRTFIYLFIFWLKEKHADIIYLQETYWTEKKWLT